ncbi:MAG TPA: HAMP domain-containing protein, partial [Acidimicrobiales bacterium]|nr:HAMP domain-containing protein [Acidimicrobiales bacterium]
MAVVHPPLTTRSWWRLPRRTARLRLTTLYGGLFLLSGVAFVSATYVLFERATAFKTPHVPKILQAGALTNLLNQSPLGLTIPKLQYVKGLLQRDQTQLTAPASSLVRGKEQIAQDQHQLTQAVSQLTHAVSQLAKTSTVEAAQRAADSHRLLVTSGIVLAIVTILALLAGWFVAGRMLRPIRTITRAARRISSSNLHERLALEGPKDELKELGDTLDDLFERLDASFEAQRHFVANASHELRTPLTVERTLLQVALDDPDTTIAQWRTTATEALAYSDEQTRLIEALLTLASSESGIDGCESLDLAAVVTSTLANVRAEAQRAEIHVDVVLAPAPLQGDPLLIERLVANLLSNAVRHNVVGGRVEVVTEMKNGAAMLCVSNTGPNIPVSD